jgi:hypothetical protein
MRLDGLIALGIGSALALGGPALAQQPAPPPAPAADYGLPITNEQAKTVAAAALAEAKKNNSPMAFAIVGPAGELVYFEKMDGTQLASVEIAQGKARTAVLSSVVRAKCSRISMSRAIGHSRPFRKNPLHPKAAFRLS